MERLTTTNKDVSREMICRNENCGVTEEHCPHLMEDECACLRDVINKLAKYEDLEQQCIEENQCGIRELLLKWKEFFDDIAELYDYRAIGTVSEFRELMEKATAKSPAYQGEHEKCPTCGSFCIGEYCIKCGQRILFD